MIVKKKVFGTWKNAGKCVRELDDKDGPCGPGKIDQIRTCEDGTLVDGTRDECTTTDKERTSDCEPYPRPCISKYSFCPFTIKTSCQNYTIITNDIFTSFHMLHD